MPVHIALTKYCLRTRFVCVNTTDQLLSCFFPHLTTPWYFCPEKSSVTWIVALFLFSFAFCCFPGCAQPNWLRSRHWTEIWVVRLPFNPDAESLVFWESFSEFSKPEIHFSWNPDKSKLCHQEIMMLWIWPKTREKMEAYLSVVLVFATESFPVSRSARDVFHKPRKAQITWLDARFVECQFWIVWWCSTGWEVRVRGYGNTGMLMITAREVTGQEAWDCHCLVTDLDRRNGTELWR